MKHIKKFNAFLEAIGFKYPGKSEEETKPVRKELGYGKNKHDEVVDDAGEDVTTPKEAGKSHVSQNSKVLEPTNSAEQTEATRRKVIPPFGYPGVTKRSMQRKAAEERQRQSGK